MAHAFALPGTVTDVPRPTSIMCAPYMHMRPPWTLLPRPPALATSVISPRTPPLLERLSNLSLREPAA